MLRYHSELRTAARKLRRQSTDAERYLWLRLRKKQILDVQFYRQRPIGQYIVDFYAPRIALVIEVDGGQHFESDAIKRDATRTQFLQAIGLSVLRFDNQQVLVATEAVVARIYHAVALVLGAGE
jgi:very-short-patch-repair endonuclease